MLFPYKFVPHQMDTMQIFIDYIFHEVWCIAPAGAPFDLALFDGNVELKAVMTLFYHGDTNKGDWFYARVEQIYGFFAVLTPTQITQLKDWYRDNNNIEQACLNNTGVQLAKYSAFTRFDETLVERLKDFFKGLYCKELLNSKTLKDKIDTVDNHYKAFREINEKGKCPFCGINDLKTIHQTKREAYDHYLPKALYPFNTINFHNLAPTCHECNSSYKTVRDPIQNSAGVRRKAFYPFSTTNYNIEINIQLNLNDWASIKPAEIQLAFGPAQYQEQIGSWKHVYGIEERYKAKCSSADDGKEWIVQLMDEWKNDDKTPEQYMATLTRQTVRNPYSDLRFLKKAFLDSCDRAGLFDHQLDIL